MTLQQFLSIQHYCQKSPTHFRGGDPISNLAFKFISVQNVHGLFFLVSEIFIYVVSLSLLTPCSPSARRSVSISSSFDCSNLYRAREFHPSSESTIACCNADFFDHLSYASSITIDFPGLFFIAPALHFLKDSEENTHTSNTMV